MPLPTEARPETVYRAVSAARDAWTRLTVEYDFQLVVDGAWHLLQGRSPPQFPAVGLRASKHASTPEDEAAVPSDFKVISRVTVGKETVIPALVSGKTVTVVIPDIVIVALELAWRRVNDST